MGNLHKAGHISDLTWWIRYSISTTFQDLINELGEICFPLGKWNFEPIWNFTHTTEYLTLGNLFLILILSLYLQMLMQISTQTNNHKYRKSITTKKVYSLKNGILFQNPKFNILCKIAFIFYMKCQPFTVQRSMRPFGNK